ncbi:MAG: phasin family protein [Lysobacter sp.]|nr:phasin family protein [Lysobacter sp.]
MPSHRKSTRSTHDQQGVDPAEVAAQAARLSRSVSDTAQQIWLAGVGAFARAQAESTKLFEGLVNEGLNLEKSAIKFADTQADVVRGAIGSGVDAAAERAAGTWEQLEAVVEGVARRALGRLGLPDQQEVAELRQRVDSLSAELDKRNSRRPAAAAERKPAAANGSSRSTKPAKAASKVTSRTTNKVAKSTKKTARRAPAARG